MVLMMSMGYGDVGDDGGDGDDIDGRDGDTDGSDSGGSGDGVMQMVLLVVMTLVLMVMVVRPRCVGPTYRRLRGRCWMPPLPYEEVKEASLVHEVYLLVCHSKAVPCVLGFGVH